MKERQLMTNKLILILLFSISLIGCTSKTEYQEEMSALVKTHKIYIGMTKDEAFQVLGKPYETIRYYNNSSNYRQLLPTKSR